MCVGVMKRAGLHKHSRKEVFLLLTTEVFFAMSQTRACFLMMCFCCILRCSLTMTAAVPALNPTLASNEVFPPKSDEWSTRIIFHVTMKSIAMTS